MAPIARKYLIAQATTASIERFFSHAGLATAGRKVNTQETLLNAKLIIHLNKDLAESIDFN
jgi:hypothetical protein